MGSPGSSRSGTCERLGVSGLAVESKALRIWALGGGGGGVLLKGCVCACAFYLSVFLAFLQIYQFMYLPCAVRDTDGFRQTCCQSNHHGVAARTSGKSRLSRLGSDGASVTSANQCVYYLRSKIAQVLSRLPIGP